jgi:hypothetical protein
MSASRSACAALAAALLLLTACQPVDGDLPARDADGPTASPVPPQPGAPSAGSGLTAVAALLSEQATTAAEWQEGAVPVEIDATVADGAWTDAAVLYLAPDADRVLRISSGAGGTRQERPTLATLGFFPIPPGALDAVSPLPADALDPPALADAAVEPLEACGAGDEVVSVVYASGAPAAWDGERWTSPPAWRAVAWTSDGDGVRLDPVTGGPAADPCVG